MLNATVIKGVVLESPLVTAAYRAGAIVRARAYAAFGRRWKAISAQLRALRASSAGEHSPAVMRAVRAQLDWGCRNAAGQLVDVRSNKWLAEFLGTREARTLRNRFDAWPDHHRVRIREPNDENPQRQGDLILLKRYDSATGEKGVILLKYTQTLWRFPAMFDLAALASRYSFVLEPSSWGYEDPGFFLYTGADMDVVVQSPWRRDHEFITQLESNLQSVRIGAGDWVDPHIFSSNRPARDRRFDIVAVSAWSALKRHEDLFRAVAALKAAGRKLQIALIGYPLDWTQDKIRQLARKYGIEHLCTIYEAVPHSVVADVVGDSRLYVLMSRREGANKALYEALWCDTPVAVFNSHRGVNTDIVGGDVGILYGADGLTAAIMIVLDDPDRYHARQWAERNTGYRNSTAALNATLKRLAEARGLPWTEDIAEKINSPELVYANPLDVERFAGEYESLHPFLR
jgi:glycosyltransferase involved in cell wall biosynthesis